MSQGGAIAIDLTNVNGATGGATPTYQWQSGAGTCETATFANIVGATGPTYDPPAGLTVTTSYRRVATSTLNTVAVETFSFNTSSGLALNSARVISFITSTLPS